MMRAIEKLLFVDGQPKNPELFELAVWYMRANGNTNPEPLLKSVVRVWMLVETEPSGERKCVGLTSFQYTVDIPFFHVDDDKGKILLTRRLENFLDELGHEYAMVYVEPRKVRDWKGYLQSRMAKAAFRWIVKVRS